MKLSNMARIFKALGCEQRIRLLELLHEWQGFDNCCDGVTKAFTRASEELKISRSTLSHHFKELENAGLIECVREGQTISCKVCDETIALVRSFLKD